MTTERIAQTFPDINSQGLNTSGTAAGVRSFPDPFVGVSTGIDVLVQRGIINVPVGSLTATFVLPTPVDVARSWIIFMGQDVKTSTIEFTRWRVHLSFASIVGGFSDTVLVTRLATGTELDVHFQVVAYPGTGGTSIDVKIAHLAPNGLSDEYDFKTFSTASQAQVTIVDPTTGLDLDLGSQFDTPPGRLTNFWDRAFPVLRGIDWRQAPPSPSVITPTSRFHPEQWHGRLLLRRNFVGVRPSAPTGFVMRLGFEGLNTGNGFASAPPRAGPPGPHGCGSRLMDVYADFIWFPPPG